MSESQFCWKCGTSIPLSNNYCSKCGAQLNPPILPKEGKLVKSERIGNTIAIVAGIIILLSGVYFSNPYSVIIGIVLFCIGFVSLKSNSKTVQQLVGIISLIIFIVAIINLMNFYS